MKLPNEAAYDERLRVIFLTYLMSILSWTIKDLRLSSE